MSFLKKLLIISSLIPILFSCRGEEIAVEEQNTEQQAMITFLTGDVMQLINGNWEYAEIGDMLKQNDKILVKADSYCEIMFSDRAVIRIEENTNISLSTLKLIQNQFKIGIELVAGSVLCKVEKLTSNERFKVSTKTAVFSVRGTEFRVTAAPTDTKAKTETTLIAVQEGSVAVTPPELEVEKLAASTGANANAVAEVLNKIEAAAPLVSADEQLFLTEETFTKSSAAIEQLREIIKVIVEEKEEEAVSEHLQKLDLQAEAAIEIISNSATEKTALTAENARKLEAIKEIRMIDIPVQRLPDEDVQTESSDDSATIPVYTLKVEVEPADTAIFINSTQIGTGSFAGIFKDGEDLNIDFIRDGYEMQHHEISVSEANAGGLKIVMKKPATPAAAAPETQAEQKSEPEPKPLEAVVSISTDKLIGSVTSDSGLFFTFDRNGTLAAVTPGGRIAWSIQTENGNIENSFPSAGKGLVCVSGAKEYLVINAASGVVIIREALDKDSAHIFGRRLVPTLTDIMLPTNTSIVMLNRVDGTEKYTIPLPGDGSRMTPALYKEEILSVDPQGTFYIIDSNSGKTVKSISTGAAQPIALSITIKENLALFSGRKGTVACIDLNSDQKLWEKQLPGSNQVFTDIVCSKDAAHIFSKGKIFSLSLETGKEILPAITKASAPPAVFENQLVYGSTDRNLIFANASDGQIEKMLAIGDVISTRPAVLDGKIAAGTESGKMYIINPEKIQ